jgi:hypothetical protein
VFNGTFTLEAIEGICTGADVPAADVLDVLGALVAKSLVTAHLDGRFRLLETVRLYAEERLAAAGEAELLHDRHRDWFLAWADSFPASEALFSSDVGDRMEQDHGNIAAAVSWSLATDHPDAAGRLAAATNPMWRFHYHYEEAAAWLGSVLAQRRSLDPDVRVTCGAWAAQAAMMLAKDDTVVDVARAATEVEGAAATGPLAVAWSSVANMAGIKAAAGDDPHAPELERALDCALTVHTAHDWWRFMALSLCSNALMAARRYPEAVTLAEECRNLAVVPEEARLGRFGGASHGVLIVGWHVLGADDRSLAEAERGLRLGVPGTRWAAYEGIALAVSGDIPRGRARALETLHGASERKFPLGEAETLIALGAIEAIAHNYERASVLLAAGRSLGRARRSGFRTPMSFAIYALYLPLVRSMLDGRTARRCLAQGRGMTLEQALEYAHRPASA